MVGHLLKNQLTEYFYKVRKSSLQMYLKNYLKCWKLLRLNLPNYFSNKCPILRGNKNSKTVFAVCCHFSHRLKTINSLIVSKTKRNSELSAHIIYQTVYVIPVVSGNKVKFHRSNCGTAITKRITLINFLRPKARRCRLDLAHVK